MHLELEIFRKRSTVSASQVCMCTVLSTSGHWYINVMALMDLNSSLQPEQVKWRLMDGRISIWLQTRRVQIRDNHILCVSYFQLYGPGPVAKTRLLRMHRDPCLLKSSAEALRCQ